MEIFEGSLVKEPIFKGVVIDLRYWGEVDEGDSGESIVWMGR